LTWPIHDSVRVAYDLDRLVWAIALPGLATLALMRQPLRRAACFSGLAALWIVASVVPIAGVFAIANDLEGTRYIYAAAVAWSLLLAAGVESVRTGRRPAAALVLPTLLVVTAASLTWRQQRPWQDAATIRDAILPVIAAVPAECARVFVASLPDTHDGAHLARNGVPQALRLVHGRTVEFVPTPTETPPSCRLDFAAFSQ
jgi:hypothetical protein